MKIVFNCLNSGIRNNGGSRTLLRCQQVLKELGHTCKIAATIDEFTWFKHDSPIPRLPNDFDVVIATGCTTVTATLRSKIKNKFWYIRGHETWVPKFDENILINMYKNPKIIKIVNSSWLKELLGYFKIDCHLVYQGIDLHWWQDLHLRNKQDKFTIGCLYSKKKSKGFDQFEIIAKQLGQKNYRYITFGNNENKNIYFADECYFNVNAKKLNEIYSKCDIWFAPTSLEGLHNVPMEAALCGCEIVCSDYGRNGMSDYAKNETAHIYHDGELYSAIAAIEDLRMKVIGPKNQHMVQTIKHKICSRERNMKKLIEILKGGKNGKR